MLRSVDICFVSAEKWQILTTLSEFDSNPKLVALKKMILKAYDEEPDTYAILFTRTKIATEALKSWVNEDPDMSHIGALRITGTSSEDTAGSFSLSEPNFTEFYFQGRRGGSKVVLCKSEIQLESGNFSFRRGQGV